MNKHLYRVIFSKALGQLVVVGEAAKSKVKSPRTNGTNKTLSPSLIFKSSVLFAAMGLPWLAQAQIQADASAPSNQQPQVFNSSNGVPLVNIQTPSAAGVSRNQYTRFDVSKQGAILNNARADQQSQLGGWIQANPNLASGAAKVILNEVNSANPSLLNGFIEIAGQRAEMVLANPAGITCDGCGFINSSRTTLTTGAPVFENGVLTGYQVNNGTVNIEGDGLNDSSSDYTQILARALEVNAGIWANDLKITTGVNTLDLDGSLQSSTQGSADAPTFALDVSQLGGMYAGKIQLVGTEAGVGVRNAGIVGAEAGSITIDAKGQLINSGNISAAEQLIIEVDDELNNTSGTLAAKGNISVDANTLNNNDASLGSTEGSVDITTQQEITNARGLITGQKGVVINAASIDNNSGTISSDDETVNINSLGALLNNDGFLLSQSLLDVNASEIDNTNGKLESQSDIKLTLHSASELAGSLNANNDIAINASGQLTHTGEWLAENKITLSGVDFTQQADALIDADDIELSASSITNEGLINGLRVLLQAQQVTNQGTGRIYGDQLAIAADTLINQAISTDKAIIGARDTLNLGVNTLINKDGSEIISLGKLTIAGSLDENQVADENSKASLVSNQSALIESFDDLTINTARLENLNVSFELSDQPLEVSQESVTEYQISGHSQRYAPNQISTYDDEVEHLVTPTGRDDNWNLYQYDSLVRETQVEASDPGEIIAAGDINITADTVYNDNSHILAGENLVGVVGSLTNTETTGERHTLDVGTVTNYYRIQEKGDDRQGTSTRDYEPAEKVQTIKLGVSRYESGVTYDSDIDVPVGDNNNSGGDSSGVRVLDDGGLFQFNEDPTANFLLETDPAFTNRQQWLSSDFILSRVQIDPTKTQLRIGDGFYEQRLVREQIAQLTGQRFLNDHSDDEAQYQELMLAGVTFATEHMLVPGIALSAQQIEQLTSDIVWLVEETVRLADGTEHQVLSPKVYLQVQPGDLESTGSLLAGNNINLNISDEFTNSGTLMAADTANINAADITNNNGQLHARDLDLVSQGDINNVGGILSADERLSLWAAGDINSTSTTQTHSNDQGHTTNLDRIASLYVGTNESDQSLLLTAAGGDINLIASHLENQGTLSTTTLNAGGNVNLATLQTSSSLNLEWDSDNWRQESASKEIGAQLNTVGDLEISAGQDITLAAAQINSTAGAINAEAGGSITLREGRETRFVDEAHKTTGSNGAFSSKTISTRKGLEQNLALGSTLSGQQISLQAGDSLTIQGSQVVADQAVTLSGENIHLTAAEETYSNHSERKEKKSGIFSSGGIGFTAGQQKRSIKDDQVEQLQSGSFVGSLEGNVDISAEDNLQITASEAFASGDINLTAKSVIIDTAQQTTRSEHEEKFSQSGISVSITSSALGQMEQLTQTFERGSEVEDPRLQAAYAMRAKRLLEDTALLDMDKGDLEEAIANPKEAFKISISLGASKSENTTINETTTAVGSRLSAGGATNITTTENIQIEGGSIEGHDVALNAGGDIQLTSGENTQHTDSENSSSSASIGISLGQGGLQFSVGASMADGYARSSDDQYLETIISADNELALSAGGDTTLKGAQLKGDSVALNVGGDLNIISEQDESHFESEQKSASVGVSIGIGGAPVSVSVALSKTEIEAEHRSVEEQSGIFAGSGGFDVEVGGNTHLTGAAIVAEDNGEHSRLKTASLSYDELENVSKYNAESQSISFSTSTDTGGGSPVGIGGGFANDSDEKQSTTRSALSAATLEIGDDSDLSGLASSAEEAHTPLENVFDQGKVEQELAETRELVEVFSEEAAYRIGTLYEDVDAAEYELEAAKKRQDSPETIAQLEEDLAAAQAGLPPKAVAHAIVSGIASGLGGGNVVSGAASAGLSELLVKELANSDIPGSEAMAKSDLATNLLAVASGVLASTATGGGAHQGAVIAGNTDKYNRQLHPIEAQMLDQAKERIDADSSLTDAEKDQQIQEIKALACAQVRCAEGVPTGDDKYQDILDLQTYGELLALDGAHLSTRLGELGISTQLRGPIGRMQQTTDAFSYNESEWITDTVSSSSSAGYFNHVVDKAEDSAVDSAVFAVTATAAKAESILTGSEGNSPAGLAGFTDDRAAQLDDTLSREYDSDIGQRVLDSFSMETYREAPDYVTDTTDNVLTALPVAGVGYKVAKEGIQSLAVLSKASKARKADSHEVPVEEVVYVSEDIPPVTFTGSGPVPGVIAIHPKVQSTKALENYVPKNGSIEFVYDPKTKTFAVGKPNDPIAAGLQGSPHQQLAGSINADPTTLVGGTLQRGKNGEFITNEFSGHYGQNWTPEVRAQYREFLESMTGKKVDHEIWGN